MKKLIQLSLIFIGLLSGSAVAAEKVLIVVTSHAQMGETDEQTGFWLTELTHPYYELTEAGIEVDIASIKGGPAPIDPRSINVEEKDTQVFLNDTALMAKVYTTLPLAKLNANDYDAILFSGGHGTMWDFTENQHISSMSQTIYQNGGIVSALCHGPAALLNIKSKDGQYLISGVKVTGFTNQEEAMVKLDGIVPYLLESELKKRGTKFESGPAWQPKVVVDKRIVTGQNPQSAQLLGETLVKLIK